MFQELFRKENDLDESQGDQKSLGHPQPPPKARPWGVKQVPVILIKNFHGECLLFSNRFKMAQE